MSKIAICWQREWVRECEKTTRSRIQSLIHTQAIAKMNAKENVHQLAAETHLILLVSFVSIFISGIVSGVSIFLLFFRHYCCCSALSFVYAALWNGNHWLGPKYERAREQPRHQRLAAQQKELSLIATITWMMTRLCKWRRRRNRKKRRRRSNKLSRNTLKSVLCLQICACFCSFSTQPSHSLCVSACAFHFISFVQIN